MTPMDFLDFRDFLVPASGFQSVQFRKIENKLGLLSDNRFSYGGENYKSYLNKSDHEEVKNSEYQNTLFELTK